MEAQIPYHCLFYWNKGKLTHEVEVEGGEWRAEERRGGKRRGGWIKRQPKTLGGGQTTGPCVAMEGETILD